MGSCARAKQASWLATAGWAVALTGYGCCWLAELASCWPTGCCGLPRVAVAKPGLAAASWGWLEAGHGQLGWVGAGQGLARVG